MLPSTKDSVHVKRGVWNVAMTLEQRKRQTYNELIPLQKNKANIDSNRGLNMIDSLETATV